MSINSLTETFSFNNYSIYFKVINGDKTLASTYDGQDYKYEFKSQGEIPVTSSEILNFNEDLFEPGQMDTLNEFNSYNYEIDGEYTFLSSNRKVYSKGDVFLGLLGESYTILGENTMRHTYFTGGFEIADITLYYPQATVTNELSYGPYYLSDYNEILFAIRDYMIPIIVVSGALSLILLVLSFVMVGRKKGVDGVYLNIFNRIPFEIILALYLIIIFVTIGMVFSPVFYEIWFYYIPYLAVFVASSVCLLVSIAARVKAGTLIKNTIIFKISDSVSTLAKKLFVKAKLGAKAMSITAKFVSAAVGFALFYTLLLSLSFVSGSIAVGFFIVLIILIALIFASFIFAGYIKSTHDTAKQIADGDFYVGADEQRGFGFGDIAKDLNRIGDSIQVAVNERMKSETLKSELITNVSHDIKTPLTSIINYVDLISKEQCDNEKINEYTVVLERQAKNLSRLLSDLVDAAKVSSKSISVEPILTDLSVVSQQLVGEYEEQFSKNNLELILNCPEKAVYVMADPRHLQRITDNLMSNVVKYSLPHSRVYLDILEGDSQASIVIKNISKNAINMDAEFLTERFIRGDSSRNSEGNGLGLYIAKTLAEAQNARLDIVTDGDLFKVFLTFLSCPPTDSTSTPTDEIFEDSDIPLFEDDNPIE